MNLHINQLLELVKNGRRVCTDSRACHPGDIFFALHGENHDGNRYAQYAINAGCDLAVIDNPKYNQKEKYLLVENALNCLQQTAKSYRETLTMPVLGITGTNGKTTTKELVRAVLSTIYTAPATQGNLNNHIGVPLTLLSLKSTDQLAIIEMGANHLGEIAELADLSMPSHAIITNIGKAHLEGFGSIENIEKAKSELYHYVNKNNGTLFVNCDDVRLQKFASAKNSITYGTDKNNHCSGSIVSSKQFVSVDFIVNKDFGKATKGMYGRISSHLSGRYNYSNIMAAVATGLYFGVPVNLVINAIESYQPTNHRSQVVHTANNTVLMDAYNANPTSMELAIENFRDFDGKPKALLLGDMLELGKDAKTEHQLIAEMTDDTTFNARIFVGEQFTAVCKAGKNAMVFNHVDDAASWLKNNPLRGYQILVKGSRGIKMEKLLDLL